MLYFVIVPLRNMLCVVLGITFRYAHAPVMAHPLRFQRRQTDFPLFDAILSLNNTLILYNTNYYFHYFHCSHSVFFFFVILLPINVVMGIESVIRDIERRPEKDKIRAAESVYNILLIAFINILHQMLCTRTIQKQHPSK